MHVRVCVVHVRVCVVHVRVWCACEDVWCACEGVWCACEGVWCACDKGWSLPYAQYLELRPGSQCGHWVTKVFSVRSQGHEGFSKRSQPKFKSMQTEERTQAS